MQPQREVAGDDAAGLEVAGAAFGHLGVVDAGELGVELAGGVGGADHGGPAQGRPGLGHRLALAVGLAGLAGPGGQAQEGLEVVAAGEPAGLAHDGGHGRAADLGQARQRPGDLGGVDLAVGVLAGGGVGRELGLDRLEQADLGGHLGARSANGTAGSPGPYNSIAACAAAAHCAARAWPWWPRDAELISAVSWAGPAASSARGSA